MTSDGYTVALFMKFVCCLIVIARLLQCVSCGNFWCSVSVCVFEEKGVREGGREREREREREKDAGG